MYTCTEWRGVGDIWEEGREEGRLGGREGGREEGREEVGARAAGTCRERAPQAPAGTCTCIYISVGNSRVPSV